MTLIFIVLAIGVWLVGGNILIAIHYHRLGKSVWSGLKPRVFPFKDFNALEWIILLILAIIALVFIGLAITANEINHGEPYVKHSG